MPRRRLHEPPSPLLSIKFPKGTLDPEQAAARARARIDAARQGWPAGCQVIIDTREQRPYTFPGAARGTLQTGDYSVDGYQDKIAVERKSLADAWASIGSGAGAEFKRRRDRFRREWERLALMPYPAVVLECTMEQLNTKQPRRQVDPNKVVGTYLSWGTELWVPVWLCGSREHGQRTTGMILRVGWRGLRRERS